MDPITVATGLFHGAGPGAAAHATALGNKLTGLVYGQAGPQTFSFSDNGVLGKVFSLGGKAYSLKPDLISRVPLGQSFSVYDGLNRIGSAGQSPLAPDAVFGGDLGSQLGTTLGTSLKATGLL